MSYNLDKYTLQQLRALAKEMGLAARRSKSEMIRDISSAFSEYETYKKEKIDKYRRLRQLGNKGKEGTTYLIVDEKGSEFAMKTFRKAKSSSTLKREYKFLKKAGKAGISPSVYSHDTVSKYIIMDVMEKHLVDAIMTEQKGVLYRYQQLQVLQIFRTLDELKIFHGDANLTNYMLKGKKIYIIDFGFAREITDKLCKKLGTENPNSELMLLGFILKLKELKCESASWKYLLKHLPKKTREKYGLIE